MSKNIKTLKTSILLMIITLISRILGLVRALVIAYFFGANYTTDAFYSAFRISNLFRQMLGEGALGTAFIPIYNEKHELLGKKEADDLIFLTLNLLCVILLILSLIFCVFSKQIVDIIVFGYSVKTKLLASHLLKIMSFYLFFIGISGMIGAILNNFKKFVIPASTSIFFNIVIILFIIFFRNHLGIYSLAWGVFFAGIIQVIVVLPLFFKNIFRYKLIFSLTDTYLRKIFLLVLPRVAAVFTMQLNLIVDQFFASFLIAGSVSALTNATLLYNLPIGVFAISIGTVIFPKISKAAVKLDFKKIKFEVETGLKILMFLVIPSLIVLVFYSHSIVTLIYDRGKFTSLDVLLTSHALAFYAIGLYFFCGNQILNRAFYAMKNTKDPVKFSITSIIINIILCASLVFTLKIEGIALATSIASFINFILLYKFYNKKYIKLKSKNLFKFFTTTFIIGIISLYCSLYFSNFLLQLLIFVIVYFVIWVLIFKFIGKYNLKTIKELL